MDGKGNPERERGIEEVATVVQGRVTAGRCSPPLSFFSFLLTTPYK